MAPIRDALSFKLPPALSEFVERAAEKEGVSESEFCLAVLFTLVHRYTGQTHVAIRSLALQSTTVGGQADLYPQPIVLEIDLSGDLSFRQLLARVQVATTNPVLFDDKDEWNGENLYGAWPLSRRVAFTFGAVVPSSQGLLMDRAASESADVEFQMRQAGRGIEGWVRYNPEQYDFGAINRMIGHYQTLLGGIQANPEEPIGNLPILTETEHRLIIREWNATEVEYSGSACAHHLIEEQARRTPDSTAVVFEEQELSFRELDERSNQLAHHLVKLGVGPDVPVGICVERSPAMVIGLLGILKAGGAYVPMDPSYPQERLAFILEDARPPVLLTRRDLADHLPSTPAERIYLDSDWSSIAEQPRTAPTSMVSAENLAYIIYTSGSTGKPKGVMIEHRGLVNYLSWAVRSYASADGRGAAVHSPLGFDLTVTSLFFPLLTGQPVVLVPEAEGVEGVGNLLKARGNFALLKITPAHLDVLRQILSPEQAADRADVFVIGGEALSAENLAFWREHAPRTRLVNEYGPTETVVGCCIYQVDSSDPGTGPIPIGRPIANTRLYILDARLNPVPVGVVGELYIGGAGVARGYLNRPELTRERFLADPFAQELGARMYRTGDLARYRADGVIEFLGRSDDQVKLRGYRIELGEIEAALGEHPAVQQAVVAVKERGPGNPMLVAYVVPRAGRSFTSSEMRDALLTSLPEYMIPSALVLLNTLPLSPNGKVDRRALPLPEAEPVVVAGLETSPTDVLELELLKLWRALGLRATGIDDNFFELGGHSLLGLRLFAGIKDSLGKELPLTTLFAAPTIKQLAEILRQEGVSSTTWSSLIPIQPNGSKPPVFFVHPIGGDVLAYFNLAQRLGSNQPFYGLRARGLDGRYDPDRDIQSMAEHYITEMLTVQPNGPFRLGGYSFGGVVAFEMARRLRQDGYEVALLAILDSDASQFRPAYAGDKRNLLKMLRNMPTWIQDDLLRNPPARTWSRTRKKIQRLWQPGGAKRNKTGLDVPGLDLYEMFDLYDIPDQYRAVWEASAAALHSYVPEQYPGRITLFRVRVDPLFGPFDPHRGWARLAREGVDVKMVSGHHDKLLVEPYVKTLSAALRTCL